MSGYCDGLISASIRPDCADLLVRGLEQEGIIMNRSDVDMDNIVYNDTNDAIISSLVLKTTPARKAYKVVIPNKTPFTGTGTELNVGTNRNTFNNTVGMIILANNPDVTKDIIDGLANGEYVVILENKSKSTKVAGFPGYSAFQVYGLLQGLRATEISQDKWSADTDGGWNVVLTEEGVPTSALFFWNTDLETTRAALESLTE